MIADYSLDRPVRTVWSSATVRMQLLLRDTWEPDECRNLELWVNWDAILQTVSCVVFSTLFDLRIVHIVCSVLA